MNRETLPGGQIHLSTERCTYLYTRLRPGSVLITISGYDRGELGLLPFEELKREIKDFGPVEVFIDVRQAFVPTAPVSEGWQNWIKENRQNLKRVYILVESRAMYIVVSISKELSRTGSLMQVFTDHEKFRNAIQRSAPDFEELPVIEQV
jgi:hypothetical protein